MKVLLTGANGFVGSHILERLLLRGVQSAVLLRPGCDRGFIEPLLPSVSVRTGSLADPASLRGALREITHVIHAAGKTKAVRLTEFNHVNQQGTAQLVESINGYQGTVRRLVHLSSLAAARPGT